MAGRVDQDIELVATLPTSSKARLDQDTVLTATLPTSSKARWDTDVVLVALGKIHPKVWVSD